MVSQLTKANSFQYSFDYIQTIYEVCLKRHLNNPGITFDSINRGRKILQSEQEVDAYIAFYGAHHYYKLLEVFNILDISIFSHVQLEIFSYGCGAAIDTCSLITYCRANQINLPFQSLKLIEPSLIALDRGCKYIEQALSSEELASINIQRIYESICQLDRGNLLSNPKADKLHVFSNILDVQEIDLHYLAQLIKETQLGTNYFVCVNPKNSESIRRIDDFYKILSSLFAITNIDINDEDITGKQIYRVTAGQYSNQYPIRRYHRIFKTI